MEGSQWGVVAHLDDRARALDEAAADEEGELEVLDPPAADRGSCPLSDHPRGITSEAVQLTGARTRAEPCVMATLPRLAER